MDHLYNVVINVYECWMNFYYNCFKKDNYFRRGRYLSDNNDDRPKTEGDCKPKHYHIYMYTENKTKSHKATISNICVYYKLSLLLHCC